VTVKDERLIMEDWASAHFQLLILNFSSGKGGSIPRQTAAGCPPFHGVEARGVTTGKEIFDMVK